MTVNSGSFVLNNNVLETIGGLAGTGGTVQLSGGSVLTVNQTTSTTYAGLVFGGGGFTKSGTGTLTYTGTTANTHTGVTSVNGGTLALGKTAGVNAIGGSLVLNTSGVVQLNAANQIADTSTVTFSSGTFRTGQTVGFSDTVGTLDLNASSTIALGTGSHTLQFSGIAPDPTGTLTITGWTGNALSSGTDGDILISGIGSDPNSEYADFLSRVQFSGYELGQARFITTGTNGTYELTPVPEPGAILAVCGLAVGGVAAWRKWRRKRPATFTCSTTAP